MKKCPHCAEEIQDEATVCRHCSRDLTTTAKPPAINITFIAAALLVIAAAVAIILSIQQGQPTIP